LPISSAQAPPAAWCRQSPHEERSANRSASSRNSGVSGNFTRELYQLVVRTLQDQELDAAVLRPRLLIVAAVERHLLAVALRLQAERVDPLVDHVFAHRRRAA